MIHYREPLRILFINNAVSRRAGKPRFLTATVLICSSPMRVHYCANCQRSRLRKRLTIGDRARVSACPSCPYWVLNYPIVSVPNQPEIPAFVASVFIRRATRDARCEMRDEKGRRVRQVVSEGISQGEIMPNVDVLAPSWVGSIVMKIFIIRKEREREREGGRREEGDTTGQQLLPACFQIIRDRRLSRFYEDTATAETAMQIFEDLFILPPSSINASHVVVWFFHRGRNLWRWY